MVRLSLGWLTLLSILVMGIVGCRGADPVGSVAPPETAAAPATESRPAPAPAGRAWPKRRATAVLAGGCFWGMEALLRELPGVLDTTVGYTGGSVPSPGYDDVKTGASGHAESVEVVFDPAELSYERLLLYFFKIHDPTTPNQQGNDVGSQYRSAIFVRDAEQRAAAERVIQKVTASGDFARPVATEIVDAASFHAAEEGHQDYLRKHPGGYTCHYERDVTFY